MNPEHPVPIVRYAFGERLIHAVTGLSYVYLLLTGLAFWTPALYWIAIMLGGGFLARAMHPWVGVVFAAAVTWMFLTWSLVMRITDEDRAWRKSMAHYIKNEDQRMPPLSGRFNYGQKMLFWVMLWAGLVLLGSGLVMWFVPVGSMPLRSVAPLVHAIAALVTIGAFIVHVYMGIAVVPGGLHAIVHGDVSEAWARHHHPAWRRPS